MTQTEYRVTSVAIDVLKKVLNEINYEVIMLEKDEVKYERLLLWIRRNLKSMQSFLYRRLQPYVE